MTRYEAIYQYEEQIREALKQAVKDTVGNPNAVEQVYVWEDGEIEYLYGTATGWLQPKDSETRQLFHVATIRGVDLTEVAFCEELPEDGDSIDLKEGTVIIEGFEHHIADLVVVDETYSLWKFDVWGDADEWTVNDRHRIAEVAIEDIDDDSEIESILVEYGVASADEYIAFDGDDHVIFAYTDDGYPLCELIENGF